MISFGAVRLWTRCVLLSLSIILSSALTPALFARPPHAPVGAPVISAIEPPGWWTNLPPALLLIRGGNLQGSHFTVSDPALHVSSTKISQNGDYAVAQLSASPSRAETVHLVAENASGRASSDYTFSLRRPASDGFAGFSSEDVMYLIMTDRFADGDETNDGSPEVRARERGMPRGWHGGDLKGILQHLDYLQTLGITTVWITPVYQNHEPDSYHGYGATNLYAVDEHYGTLADLQNLAAELHRRHMKLVLDTVPNHIGPAHPWVEDEPEPDWFHGTRASHRKAQGDFAPLVNPHAPWRDQQDILDGWFADLLPDMNQENPDVEKYLIQNAVWWVEQTGADGLRIDTFPYVGRPFWHNFHLVLHDLFPKLTTVGEIFNGDPAVTSAFAAGVTRNDLNGSVDTGLTTPFDFPGYFAIRDVLLHGQPMTKMASILRQDSLYPHPERLVPFLGNHDTKRFLGEEGATPEKLQLAFALLLTTRGMPQIYSGDEIAMTGGDDPDNRHDFPGGFGPAEPSAFDPSQRTGDQRAMHDWVEHLLTLRAKYQDLQSGDEQVLYSDEDSLVYVRGSDLAQGCSTGRGRMLVVINKSARAKYIEMSLDKTALAYCQPAETILGSLSVEPDATGFNLSAPPGASLLSWKSGMPKRLPEH